jgi:hypothetical protein
MRLPLAAFLASMSCQKIARVTGAMKKVEKGDEHESEPMVNLPEASTVYRTVQ